MIFFPLFIIYIYIYIYSKTTYPVIGYAAVTSGGDNGQTSLGSTFTNIVSSQTPMDTQVAKKPITDVFESVLKGSPYESTIEDWKLVSSKSVTGEKMSIFKSADDTITGVGLAAERDIVSTTPFPSTKKEMISLRAETVNITYEIYSDYKMSEIRTSHDSNNITDISKDSFYGTIMKFLRRNPEGLFIVVMYVY